MRADPERFAVLHDGAEAMLDELTRRYTVERRETKVSPGSAGALVRAVHLVPHLPVAAPLAVVFTERPGLVVRLGRWWVETVPRRSSDDPAELLDLVRRHVSAMIEGGLWERVHRVLGGARFEARLIGDQIDEARAGLLSARQARDARRGGYAAAVQWGPWLTRP